MSCWMAGRPKVAELQHSHSSVVDMGFRTTKSSSKIGARRQMLTTAARFEQATDLAIISVDHVGNIEFASPSASHLFD